VNVTWDNYEPYLFLKHEKGISVYFIPFQENVEWPPISEYPNIIEKFVTCHDITEVKECESIDNITILPSFYFNQQWEQTLIDQKLKSFIIGISKDIVDDGERRVCVWEVSKVAETQSCVMKLIYSKILTDFHHFYICPNGTAWNTDNQYHLMSCNKGGLFSFWRLQSKYSMSTGLEGKQE
jgi:hypothetical protein